MVETPISKLEKEVNELKNFVNSFLDTTIDYNLVRDVKAPNHANPGDAGTDFYIPNYNMDFLNDLIKKNPNRKLHYMLKGDENDNPVLVITIMPHERILVPSGVRVNIHNPYTYLRADNKSGVANNKGLIVGSDIIDYPYRGEMHLSVINTGDNSVEIQTGQKLVQMIQSYKVETIYNEISKEAFDNLPPTSRMAKGFGSSGLN